MATNGSAIAGSILAKYLQYALEEGLNIDLDKAALVKVLIRAIGDGVYEQLQELDDVDGQPPSSGHQ